MKIIKIIQHPLVKNIAILAIIYFALFSNKKNPNSLGNRYSSENIKKDFKDVTHKATFIAQNVALARSYNKEKQEYHENTKEEIVKFATKDQKIGEGNPVICGDVASISYSIFTASDHKEIYRNLEDIIIGSNYNILLEAKALGMKVGGIRTFTVKEGFKVEDEKLKSFLANVKGDLEYQLTIERAYKPDGLTISCNHE